jgi:hypothetical protein
VETKLVEIADKFLPALFEQSSPYLPEFTALARKNSNKIFRSLETSIPYSKYKSDQQRIIHDFRGFTIFDPT